MRTSLQENPHGSSHSLKRRFVFDIIKSEVHDVFPYVTPLLCYPHRRRAKPSGQTAQPSTRQTLLCHYCQPIIQTVLLFRGMPQDQDTFSLPSSVTSPYPSSANTRVNNLCNIASLPRSLTLSYCENTSC